MNTKDICYWCSNPAIGDEHIPPKGLFPKGHRNNLITVRSCAKHNQDFSKIDERMRFYMTSMGGESEIAKNHFDNKTIRGLKRKESRGLAIDLVTSKFTTTEGDTFFRENATNWDSYFEKIIKGLYFYHFNKSLKDRTHFFSNKIRMLMLSANAHFYYHTIEHKLSQDWINGNPENKEIFDYKYYYSEHENQFLVIMTFYESHKVIGISLPNEKQIDHYSLNFEEYNKLREEIINKQK
ncbi:hypothetical protein ACFSSB_15670 [Lacinutrix gracilariae]|uniref:HNH endonuclease n=1 Tax=Lacinutrix gracilariae TaxID=1747198 RepID=A0ABW5K6A5_9FLAO